MAYESAFDCMTAELDGLRGLIALRMVEALHCMGASSDSRCRDYATINQNVSMIVSAVEKYREALQRFDVSY